MKRNIELDMARALCVIYIVCFLHLQGYSPNYQWFADSVMFYMEHITNIVLGCFTFISGLFLGKKKIFTFNDILNFYKKRLSRFYLMFFVAITSIYVLSLVGHFFWFPSLKHFLVALIGMSNFTFNPPTFWFIEMLMLFYFVTPFVLVLQSKFKQICLMIGIYIFFLICYYYHHLDYRLLLYFPIYVLGMKIPIRYIEKLEVKKYLYGISIICSLLLALAILSQQKILNSFFAESLIYEIWIIFIGTMFIVVISKILCKNYMISRFGALLAYLSMAAYMFHRHIYYLFTLCGDSFESCWFNAIAAFTVLVLSFFIQKGFDKIKY